MYNNCSVTGSGYIDGFTDALRCICYDTSRNVTFPETYGNTGWLERSCVYITVNSIQKEMTIDEVTMLLLRSSSRWIP